MKAYTVAVHAYNSSAIDDIILIHLIIIIFTLLIFIIIARILQLETLFRTYNA